MAILAIMAIMAIMMAIMAITGNPMVINGHYDYHYGHNIMAIVFYDSQRMYVLYVRYPTYTSTILLPPPAA